ncbi:pectate lyase [Sphingomonas naasensis]|uniref:Pectate lyase n=1 Tax=Sphingomonas naasensis TaxID=1344951 RepID=A0A4S1WSK4_9SPHN|nr:pectate lyase [Sphingomonas naasensis]NIJ19216.1 pectate lyase [Sphingomonas naasensis]TGX46398.1 pectate lyase [Sphingomonas naasensis]
MLALTVLALLASSEAEPQPAFPGAEGAGRFAQGGRGGEVLFVTNLADNGPGSLRAAVETKGPRTILFRVSGTIRLATPLVVREGRVTIAGQSAPGGGITLRDHMLQIAADDVIVRHIRSRLGDESKTESDAITITKGRRIILDHVSASWSVDETLSVSANYTNAGQGFYDVTVQWSIISESLTHSLHAKGEHGYGSLIRGGRGSKASFHHNLWASHSARMPRPGNYSGPEVDPVGAFFDFRSNVFYNWGRTRSGYNADKATLVRYNFVDNAYVAGPQSQKPIAFDESDMLARAWFAGNSMNGTIPADPWSLVTGVQPEGYRLAQPVDVAPVTADPAASAYARVLAGAGASRVRDAVDLRVIAGVRDRTGKQIDSQREVGGWPALESLPAPPDGDGDGMPDAWERRHGLDPRRADANDDRNRDGYTNIEEWLAAAAEGKG